MTARAVSASEFEACMAALAPFERCPHVAVAVSGGADSLALVLLADAWARAQAGRVTALTVDHGLRPEAADEARRVGAWLRGRGIDHVILTWDGIKPTSGVQAAARAARYRLLDDWCGAHGVLHLTVAHHADDQAETVLLRLARGSGPDGLAAMAAARFLPHCRLLRPLLDVPKQRLVATLRAAGQDWIEDPSNENPAFARVRARQALRTAGMAGAGLSEGAARMRRARTALEAETARWLGRHAETSPLGFLMLDADALSTAEPEIRIRVLARAAHHVGGRDFPPAVSRTENLDRSLASGRAATLGGAVFRQLARGLRVCREPRNLPAAVRLDAEPLLWDGRFEISTSLPADRLRVVPLGGGSFGGWSVAERPAWMKTVPAEVLRTLPAVVDFPGFRGVPAVPLPGGAAVRGVSVLFLPKKPMSGSGFAIA